MLRNFSQSDLEQLLEIENAVHIAPWTKETFELCFKPGYHGWVVEVEKKVIGFIIVSIRVNECHILNLCVASQYQHQGWGRKLLVEAMDYAKSHHIHMVYLEVRRSNARAIALYEQMQFHLVGERKNYYPTLSGQEDALIFARTLTGETEDLYP